MKKTKKTDYIILALLCLVLLNIGAITINYLSNSKDMDNSGRDNLVILSESIDFVKGFFSSSMEGLFSLIDKSKEKDNKDSIETIAPEYKEADEDAEDRWEKDIIIDKLEEYESLIIIKDSIGINTVENIPEPFMVNKFKIDNKKPYILLYHTHATEAFLPAKAQDYRSQDKTQNVVGLGEIISTVLEANGHKVDHVQTVHDLPSYSQSYSRSLNTIRKKQEENNNFRILLDVHRNAIKDDAPNIKDIISKSKININGISVATFSLVIGPNSENVNEVLNFAKYIKAVSDTLYPGLCKEIIIKPIGRYNQYLSDHSALIELGWHINTIEEAREGAKLLGEILSLVANSLIEE